MVPEIKRAWIDSLRNDDIPQFPNALGSVAGARCCLGVLCDIAVKHGILESPIPVTDDIYILSYGGNCVTLPEVVQEWAGIADDAASFKYYDGTENCLAQLNDDGTSFEGIADIIEEYF